MDPNTKLILDEMKKLGDRLSSLESSVGDLRKSFKTVEGKADAVHAWKSEIDVSVVDLVGKVEAVEGLAGKVNAVADLAGKASAVDDLKSQVSNLSNRVDRVVLDRGGPVLGILPNPEVAAATPSAGNPAIGPKGHCVDNHLRENGYGSVLAYTHLPVKGTSSDPPTFGRHINSYQFTSSKGHSGHSSSGHWPKLPFPKFAGENPRLWQSRCENYFDMCGIDKFSWVRIATMYFDGPAARWLQSVESKAQYTDWDTFCKMVHDRFGRDQHEILIRHLFHIHQTGPVYEYIEQFSQLVDQLEAYTSITDPMYYTLRFIDGLRDDIKTIVLVQRPKDLDTAFVLASLQEEVGDSHHRRDYRKLEYGFHSKQSSKGPLPLPAPPLRDKQQVQSTSDDHRVVEAARVGAPSASKAAALRSYRRAMGLCY
jgi:hypothetical protein